MNQWSSEVFFKGKEIGNQSESYCIILNIHYDYNTSRMSCQNGINDLIPTAEITILVFKVLKHEMEKHINCATSESKVTTLFDNFNFLGYKISHLWVKKEYLPCVEIFCCILIEIFSVLWKYTTMDNLGHPYIGIDILSLILIHYYDSTDVVLNIQSSWMAIIDLKWSLIIF